MLLIGVGAAVIGAQQRTVIDLGSPVTLTAPATATAREGTASIAGRVTAADSGRPLRRAQVRISPAGRVPNRTMASVVTDDQGAYRFNKLVPGRYEITAEKVGFVRWSYGQRQPFEDGQAVELSETESRQKIDISMPRGGVIAVRVTDEAGEPVEGMPLEVQHYQFIRGERQLVNVPLTTGRAFHQTNDLGEYRFHGLPPGVYYVLASGRFERFQRRIRKFVPTYYPGTPVTAEAQPLTLALGQEIAAEFRATGGQGHQVTGRIHRLDGSTPAGAALTLAQDWGSGGSYRSHPVAADGSFTLNDLLPGSYTILVSTADGSGQASVPISVGDEDIANVMVTVAGAGTLRGRVVFEGEPPRDLSPGQLLIAPSFDGLARPVGRMTWNDDWTFAMDGTSGWAVLRLREPSNGWFLRSVTASGRDVTDTPLNLSESRDDVHITLTRTRTEITGSVTDSRSAPMTEYVVLLFADDRDHWTEHSRRIARARPDANGQFRIEGLPPGRYLVAAVTSLQPGSERDPEVLGRLTAGATAFTIGEGENRVLSLRLTQ